MSEINTFNLLQMANGATEERINIEMGNVVANILDPNTDAKKKRQLQITIDFLPSESRDTVAVSAQVKSKLMPLSAIPTMIYVGADGNGELQAVEAVKQVPGQIGLDGAEQPSEKVINIGNAKQA